MRESTARNASRASGFSSFTSIVRRELLHRFLVRAALAKQRPRHREIRRESARHRHLLGRAPAFAVQALNTCATRCCRRQSKVPRLQILAIADLDRVAKRPPAAPPETDQACATNSRGARTARAKFEDQRGDAGAVRLQRVEEQRAQRVRIQDTIRSPSRPAVRSARASETPRRSLPPAL